MKFTKSKKEIKKSPEEEYAEMVSNLTENELRDLHKDLKIDHYGNSTAAVINTASGVGLLSIRSTTRRYRTECMQIETMEARMKEMGWTPHPNRYRDAVPIAIGVAAGTTAGMSFGIINVEKNAKRTKDYVKKKDLFKTKELVETKEGGPEAEEDDVVEEMEVAESPLDSTQVLESTVTNVDMKHTVVRKPVPAPAAPETEVGMKHSVVRKPVSLPAATKTEADTSILKRSVLVAEVTTLPQNTSMSSAESVATEEQTPSVDACLTNGAKTTTKKEALFSQISVMNKKMRSFNFSKDRDGKETTISVTEIACDDGQGRVVVGADAVMSHTHSSVEILDGPPMYNI